MAEALEERLLDVRRSFEKAALLGCHAREVFDRCRPFAKQWIVQDALASQFLSDVPGITLHDLPPQNLPPGLEGCDLIIAPWWMMWVEDLPGWMAKLRASLKPDGLFLALLPGGDSLLELRHAIGVAEQQGRGGIAPHVHPSVDLRDMGMLLQRSGFALPLADREHFSLHYQDFAKLLADVRVWGGNVLTQQPRHLGPRWLWQEAEAAYRQNFLASDGKMHLTVEIYCLTAWGPAASQPLPAKRGSGQVNLAEFLQHPTMPESKE
jgi:SAM-dependent methyltransferase